MSISVRMRKDDSYWADFREIYYFGFVLKLIHTFQIFLNSAKSTIQFIFRNNVDLRTLTIKILVALHQLMKIV